MSSSNSQALEAAVNLASKEFIKGFIAGQVILCLLLFFLVQVFLLRNGEETKIEMTKRKRTLWQPKVSRPPLRQHAFDSHVLTKLGYEPGSHAFESCDWINVLLGQFIARYRSDPVFTASVVARLDNVMNSKSRPGFLAPITITDFSLGDEYPKFEAARMQFAELSSNLRAEVRFQFNDQITIGVDTQVLLNWPKPCIAALPVSLVLSVIKFSGTLALELVAHPDSSETYMAISILEDFSLEFEVRSLLGHRTKVKDLPKLASLITAKLRSVFVDEIVWPSLKKLRFPDFPLPPPTPP